MTLLKPHSFLDNDNLEILIRRVLPYFFVLLFLGTLTAACFGYVAHNSWKMGDWLINYQGGMVRRGLLGELIYQLAHITKINPGIYVVLFQMFFFSVFFAFSYVLLKRQNSLLPYVLLIFSPYIFTFQINDLAGGFRKEIIFFAILSFIVWASTLRDSRTFENFFYITLIIYPAVILTHEMLILFLPYLLVVYVMTISLTKKKFFLIALLLIPSIFSLGITIYYSTISTIQVGEIFNSIAQENYALTGGAIAFLDKDVSDLRNVLIGYMKLNDYEYYIVIVLFSLIGYIPIRKKLSLIIKNKISFFLIFISLLGTIGLNFFVADWGRSIYINLVAFFILSLMIPQTIENNQTQGVIKSVNLFSILFFIVYVFFWHIPHVGSPNGAYAKSFRTINIASFPIPEVITGLKSAYGRHIERKKF
jgi:hypothetical protein